MDKWNDEAKRLLENYQREINTEFNAKDRPELRNRIAVALQAAEAKGAKQIEDVARRMGDDANVLRAENERLTTELERVKERRCMYNDMRKENLAMARKQLDDNIKLTVERDAVEKRLSCGHRFVDWDDSYGDCAFCMIQQQAFDYDKLPHSVIECHDKIEELESQVAKLTAERDAAVASHCGTCDGSGVVDSGGVTPWDAPIDIACPECKAKRDAAVVQGLEIVDECRSTKL